MTRAELVAEVAAMTPSRRQRWMKRHGFTGTVADRLMMLVREVWIRDAVTKLKAEMESPAMQRALAAGLRAVEGRAK